MLMSKAAKTEPENAAEDSFLAYAIMLIKSGLLRKRLKAHFCGLCHQECPDRSLESRRIQVEMFSCGNKELS
jgi:hypothetical protein